MSRGRHIARRLARVPSGLAPTHQPVIYDEVSTWQAGLDAWAKRVNAEALRMNAPTGDLLTARRKP